MAQARSRPTRARAPAVSTRPNPVLGAVPAAADEDPRARFDGVAEEAAPHAGGTPLCQFGLCPICAALTALGDARPELIEHLVVASRELLLAMRALIDARLDAEAGEGRATGGGRSGRVERLRID